MDFALLEGQTLEHMRLLIEGAVVLYENDVMPLYSMAMEQERYQEAAGLDTLGAALTKVPSDFNPTICGKSYIGTIAVISFQSL